MSEAASATRKRCVYLGAAAETTFGYAQAVQVGDTIRVSGQLGAGTDGMLTAPAMLDEAGRPVDFAAMEEQMRVTYANAAKVLARLGATLADVVEETLFVLDVSAAFAVGGMVRRQAYGTERPEVASNLIGVARLALPEQLIEIALTAVRTA